MYPASTTRIRLLGRTKLDEGYQHSLLISALRSIAALQVLATHLRGELFPSLRSLPDPTLWYKALAFLTGFGHEAVVVFFLVSGWLVGGSMLNKLGQPHAVLSYAIDRLTRLWIVLIPAFVLTLAIGTAIGQVDPKHLDYAADNAYSATAFLGNLFGLQGMVVPRFGGNYPLWSLANEVWYYALFPLLLLSFTGRSPAAKLASLCVTVFIALNLTDDIVVYFALWLLGAAFSRIEITLGHAVRMLLALVILALGVYLRLTGNGGTLVVATFPEDLLFSLLFLCLLSSLQFPAERQRPGNRFAVLLGFLAPFSFTLYVVHYPVIHLIKHLGRAAGIDHLSARAPAAVLVYGALFLAVTGFAWLFHLPFEAQTYRLRRYVKRIVLESLPARQASPRASDS